MYYINQSKVSERTTKEQRIAQRKFDRDYYMKKKLRWQKYKCFFCACNIDMSGHLDHLIPIYHGGKSNTFNLFATCRNCNITKSTQQLIITNEDTIMFYINLKNEFSKWVAQKRKFDRVPPNKYVHRYWLYRADLFTRVKHTNRLKPKHLYRGTI